MASLVSAFAQGTQTATINTEHFLSNVNVAGLFTLTVDLNAMAAGDVVELRIYKMTLTAGTARPYAVMTFSGAQPADGQIVISDQIPNELTDANSVRFSLKQTFGTGRSFPWVVHNLSDSSGISGGGATAAQIWDYLTTSISTAGSIGKLLKDNIDAAISSRSTYAGADTSGTTTLLSRITQTILFSTVGNVKADLEEWKSVAPNALISGRVDANAGVVGDKMGYALTAGEHTVIAGDVATAMTSQGYTGIRAGYLDTLNGLVAAIWNALTSGFTTSGSIGKLLKDDIDATVSSRLDAASYTAPDNADITAIKAKTDNLPASPAATGDAMTLTSGERTNIAAAIWNALTSGLTTVGSIGKLLVDNIDAAISSRSTYAGTDTPGTTTLLSRIAAAITITGGKVEVNDKTGFSLTAGEHTSIASDTQTGLTAQGYSTTRAGYLDTLNGLVTAIWNALTSSFTTAGSIGKLLKDDIDAPISSVGGGGGGGGATATQIWDYLTSAIATSGSIGKFILDQLDIKVSEAKADTTAQITNAGIAGSTVTIVRGDKMSVSVTGLGGLTSRTKLYFTVKRSTNDGDTDSIIQIEETGQLLRFNRATPADATKGTLTVNDATAGNITLALDQTYTALLDVDDFSYDVEMVTASGVQTLTSGKFSVSPDVTRATS